MCRRWILEAIGVCLLIAPGVAAATPVDEEGGWTWRGGLLGSDLDRSRVFDEDGWYPGYLCDICRDPFEHPMDYVAVAYNGMFGEDPWMRASRLGIPFRIYNLEGQWVAAWFEDVVFDAVTLLPDTMEVRLRLPDGRILTFTILQGGPDLPIGDPNTEPPGDDCGCVDDGDGGSGDDPGTVPDEELPQLPEHDGEDPMIDPGVTEEPSPFEILCKEDW